MLISLSVSNNPCKQLMHDFVVNKNQTYYMCNDDSYIANETARDQLKDTQDKTKFWHLWAHTKCQGKTSAKLREKPTDNLACTLHKIMHIQQTKTALKQCSGNLREGNTNKWCTNTYTNSNETKNIYTNTTSANYSSEK